MCLHDSTVVCQAALRQANSRPIEPKEFSSAMAFPFRTASYAPFSSVSVHLATTMSLSTRSEDMPGGFSQLGASSCFIKRSTQTQTTSSRPSATMNLMRSDVKARLTRNERSRSCPDDRSHCRTSRPAPVNFMPPKTVGAVDCFTSDSTSRRKPCALFKVMRPLPTAFSKTALCASRVVSGLSIGLAASALLNKGLLRMACK